MSHLKGSDDVDKVIRDSETTSFESVVIFFESTIECFMKRTAKAVDHVCVACKSKPISPAVNIVAESRFRFINTIADHTKIEKDFFGDESHRSKLKKKLKR